MALAAPVEQGDRIVVGQVLKGLKVEGLGRDRSEKECLVIGLSLGWEKSDFRIFTPAH